jgi:hypothetical protein
MGWRSIKIRDEQKEELDKKKQEMRRKRGTDPSYSDIIGEMIQGEQDSDNKRKKKKKEEDILNLF